MGYARSNGRGSGTRSRSLISRICLVLCFSTHSTQVKALTNGICNDSEIKEQVTCISLLDIPLDSASDKEHCDYLYNYIKCIQHDCCDTQENKDWMETLTRESNQVHQRGCEIPICGAATSLVPAFPLILTSLVFVVSIV